MITNRRKRLQSAPENNKSNRTRRQYTLSFCGVPITKAATIKDIFYNQPVNRESNNASASTNRQTYSTDWIQQSLINASNDGDQNSDLEKGAEVSEPKNCDQLSVSDQLRANADARCKKDNNSQPRQDLVHRSGQHGLLEQFKIIPKLAVQFVLF